MTWTVSVIGFNSVTHLVLGYPVAGQLDDSEIPLSDRLFDLVESNTNRDFWLGRRRRVGVGNVRTAARDFILHAWISVGQIGSRLCLHWRWGWWACRGRWGQVSGGHYPTVCDDNFTLTHFHTKSKLVNPRGNDTAQTRFPSNFNSETSSTICHIWSI